MAVLRLPPVLTHAQAQACRAELAQAMAASPDRVLLLDASDLQHFDSSALAVLLALQRAALGRGCRVQVRELPAQARQLAHVYGIESGLGLSSSH